MDPAEVIDQVLAVSRRETHAGRRVSHLVYMGMGEPLHNVGATMTSLRRFTDPAALGLGVRRGTVSTSGGVPGIGKLSATGPGGNPALPPHSPIAQRRRAPVPPHQ